MTEDLNAMAVFVAVAEAKGFRAAGERLGVSASAVSQALRKLEEQLGVVLRAAHHAERAPHRGGRAALRRRCGPRWTEVRGAVAAIGELGDEPRGTLRLVIADSAESFLGGPLLAGFLAAHPHVRLDLDVT